MRGYWPAFDQAMSVIDGAEVLHPMAFVGAEFASDLREFYERRELTAIGSSDFHGNAYPGFSRTHVFVREVTEQAVLEALRTHQTVTVDRDGRAYGNDDLIGLAEANGGLARSGVVGPPRLAASVSRYTACAGLLIALLFGFSFQSRSENRS
jgi:hypothetical protein